MQPEVPKPKVYFKGINLLASLLNKPSAFTVLLIRTIAIIGFTQ